MSKITDSRPKRRKNSTSVRRTVATRREYIENNRRDFFEAMNKNRTQSSVRALRLSLKPPMSQAEFAEAVGIRRGKQEISEIEKGKRPAPKNLQLIEAYAAIHNPKWRYK